MKPSLEQMRRDLIQWYTNESESDEIEELWLELFSQYVEDNK